MPRASWKGFMRLSLVSCPVYLSPATTRTKSIRLHQVWQPKTGRVPPVYDAEEDERSSRPARAFNDDADDTRSESFAPSRIALSSARSPHGRGDRARGGRQGLRIRARPVCHLHRGGTQGA